MTLRRALLSFAALAVAVTALAQTAPSPAAPPPPLTDARVALIAAMTPEGQRDPAVQAELVHYFRQGTVLYLHHLDKLVAQSLFSLGDETRFVAAIGTRDGTDHNRIFVRGKASPHHVDVGPYVFPVDFLQRSPIEPTRNTYWHEVQHDLLQRAGVGINPRGYGTYMDDYREAQGAGSFTPLTADYHHAIIEGLGQRGAEAYRHLYDFEQMARASYAEQAEIEATREPTLAEMRHVWSKPHRQFSEFLRGWDKVAPLPPETARAYQAATGVFFSPPEDVATFYRDGGLKSGGPGGDNVGADVRVPKWVFYPTLIRMPVRIDVKPVPPPPPGKETSLTRTFDLDVLARGSVYEPSVRPGVDRHRVRRPLAEGTLTVTLEGGDEQAVVRVEQAKGTVRDVSARHREVKLSGEPLKLTFHVPDLRRTTARTTYTILLAFADDAREPLFDTAERRIEIEVDPPATQSAAASPAAPRATAPGPAPAPSAPGAARGYWKFTKIELSNWGSITGNIDEPGARSRSVRLRETRILGDVCAATFTWTDPSDRYGAGEPFSIAIQATLDEHTFTHDPRIWGDTPEQKPGTCKIDGGLQGGGGETWFELVYKEGGSIDRRSDHGTLSGVFPAPTGGVGTAGARTSLAFRVGSGAWASYVYDWVPEEALVVVRVPESPSDAVPVPPPFTPEPIAPAELTGPRPPVAPPDDGAPPGGLPEPFQPPGGDYRVVLPAGWQPLARVEGEFLFADPNNAHVIACPPRTLRYTGSFAEKRPELVSELLRREIGGAPKEPRYGRHDGLVVSVVEGGRDTTRVFVASEGRAVLFRVVAAPGVTPALPSVLEDAFATVEWLQGGPVAPPR